MDSLARREAAALGPARRIRSAVDSLPRLTQISSSRKSIRPWRHRSTAACDSQPMRMSTSIGVTTFRAASASSAARITRSSSGATLQTALAPDLTCSPSSTRPERHPQVLRSSRAPSCATRSRRAESGPMNEAARYPADVQRLRFSLPDDIFQIRLSLIGIEPPIWRRVLLPQDLVLPRLHAVLQVVMGWTNSHLHQFKVGDVCFAEPHQDLRAGADRLPAHRAERDRAAARLDVCLRVRLRRRLGALHRGGGRGAGRDGQRPGASHSRRRPGLPARGLRRSLWICGAPGSHPRSDAPRARRAPRVGRP